MAIIKIIILILSLIGYYLLFQRKVKLKEEFIPIVVLSIITLIVYIGFILNLAKLIIAVIAIIGVALFVKSTYEIIKNKEKIKLNFNMFLLVIFLFWCIWILKGAMLTHYDNFTHWGMMARELILTDKLPNFETTVVTYTSYPPGSACFIYFICKFIGFSEAKMLMAQSILIISALYTLYAFCNKRNKINYLIVSIGIIILLVINIFITDLLVDSLLPILGVAAISIIIYYRNNLKKGLVFSIPILTLIAIVKNSGFFFVLIGLTLYFIFFIRNNGFKSIFRKKYMLLILLPIAVYIIWLGHIGIVFSDSDNSKHAMSIENYSYNIQYKDKEDIKIIFGKIISNMSNIKNKDNLLILTSIAMLIGMLGYSIIRKNKELRNFAIIMIVAYILSYIIYQVGLFGMYIFSMPREEAINLATYSRYFKSMVLLNFGICIITLLLFLNKINKTEEIKSKKKIIKILSVIFIIGCALIYNDLLYKLYTKVDIEKSERNTIIEYDQKYNMESEKSYLLCVPKYPFNYSAYRIHI